MSEETPCEMKKRMSFRYEIVPLTLGRWRIIETDGFNVINNW